MTWDSRSHGKLKVVTGCVFPPCRAGGGAAKNFWAGVGAGTVESIFGESSPGMMMMASHQAQPLQIAAQGRKDRGQGSKCEASGTD